MTPVTTPGHVDAERSPGGLRIRFAEAADVEVILGMIHALAAYEREPDRVLATAELLRRWLFGPEPAAEVLLAELRGEPIGMALFYRTFSTWEGVPGIWLEDLFVFERHRRLGAGRALMLHLVALTTERGFSRLEWVALEWNTPALAFYDALGAELMHQWRVLRLERAGLARLAATGK